MSKGKGANLNDGRAITLPHHFCARDATTYVDTGDPSLGEQTTPPFTYPPTMPDGNFVPEVYSRAFAGRALVPPQVAKKDNGVPSMRETLI